MLPVTAQGTADVKSVPVTVNNFICAETDRYFRKLVKQGTRGKFSHRRQMVTIDKQDVVQHHRPGDLDSSVSHTRVLI